MSVKEQTVFRILVVDDMPAIHEDFRKVLGATTAATAELDDLRAQLFGKASGTGSGSPARFEIHSAMQGQEGLEKLKKSVAEGKPFAMAFIDMRMPPGWDGVETIREFWKVEPTLNVAICTAYSDYSPDQVATELQLDGRMLILRKPFEKSEVRQLAAMLCDKWDVGRQKAELERTIESRTSVYKHAALHDGLTELPNRALFVDRLNRILLQSRRDPKHQFAVLFVDIDHFKEVNDTLGHDAGDSVLLEIAGRINKSIREVDTVARVNEELVSSMESLTARLGGDEFAVILDGISSDTDAARVAERILSAMSLPITFNGRNVPCGVSVGIATSSLGYERSEDMLRDADTAMYHAKREGRGRYAMFDQKIQDVAAARLTCEFELREAISNNEIVPFYQPIIDMNTGHLLGFEALARWRHAGRGWISPSEFIPTAEATGLIVPLGYKILELACEQLAAWMKLMPGAQSLTMSVNLSRKQLVRPELVHQIENTIKQTGIRPENLKMEITESCVMSDVRAAVDVLKSIRKLGVQLDIDDFGTGFSSLSCLQTFPLNGLKVDRAFIKDIVKDSTQLPLLRAMITLAQGMNLRLITEGVETHEQEKLLKSLGCDRAQGFLYAKPMAAEQAFEFLSVHNGAPADNLAA